jgi:hypothetical protein
MELVVEPDIYSPSIDEIGNYIDKVPSFNIIKKGLLCPCGSRKDKLYESHSSFMTHIKTKNHQKWLSNLNLNKVNYYIENEKLQEIIQNQRLIIAKLEKDINTKNMTIDYLSQQLNTNINNKNLVPIMNLLDL